MHPNDALSPKWRIEQGTINVLYTHPSTEWSVATMTYDGIPDRVGIRWNGDINDPSSLGYPSARGNGAWFIMPDGPSQLMLAMVEGFMRARAENQPPLEMILQLRAQPVPEIA